MIYLTFAMVAYSQATAMEVMPGALAPQTK
jgi:hypothetical protein